jgi:glycyl-tRNA synthetase alpha subunit
MFEEIPKEKVIQYLKTGKFQELLNYYCKIEENDIIINYYYFKYLANSQTYDIFTNLMIVYIDSILQSFDKFNVHISIHKLSVMEIHKHIGYIRIMTDLLKTRYQDKMNKCLIYNSSNLFSQIYEIILPFIDPDTQQKIELVSKK